MPRSSHDLVGYGVMGGVLVLLVLLAALWTWAEAREWGGVWFGRRWRILRNGEAASALVLDEVTKPSLFSRGRRIRTVSARLILEVHPTAGAPYQAVTQMIRSFGDGLYVGPGKTVPVRIGADGVVLVDLEAAGAARAAAAAAKEEAFEARAREIGERRR